MKSLCIKTNDSNLQNYLLNELKLIDLEHIYFSQKQFKHYQNIIIHYTGEEDSNFLGIISSILSCLVIDELEETLLTRYIFHNYFYFNSNEKKEILDICFDLISEDFTNIFDKKFNTLYNTFFDFISSHKAIVLNGFINFRIKSYLSILEEIVDDAVNTYIVEKEYLEFISLLKIYINTQASTCNLIHLIYSNSNIILLDENKHPIDISENIVKAKYLSDISFSSNDYALNCLLNLLPQNLYIHLIDNTIDEFITTIKLIFENRVKLCLDCKICETYKKNVQRHDSCKSNN